MPFLDRYFELVRSHWKEWLGKLLSAIGNGIGNWR